MPNPTSISVLDSASATQTISTLDALLAVFGALADAAAANGASGTALAYLRAIKDAATSAASSSVTLDQSTPGTTNGIVLNSVNAAAYALLPAPSTYRVLTAAASTNGANIKASAGAVKGIQGYNAKATAVYLKLYNKVSSPTVGTDVPVKTIYLPPTAAFAFDFGTGVGFATGIGISLNGAAADADTTALSSGDILGLNVDYH